MYNSGYFCRHHIMLHRFLQWKLEKSTIYSFIHWDYNEGNLKLGGGSYG